MQLPPTNRDGSLQGGSAGAAWLLDTIDIVGQCKIRHGTLIEETKARETAERQP